MQYNYPELLSAVGTGETFKYLYFWGHQPRRDGQISGSCFSQWWEGHPFEEDGKTYLTAEHYMMAGKAKLFNDQEILAEIFTVESPAAAKALGRKVRGFENAAWNAKRCEIVVQGNYLKFSQHPELKTFLLGTQNRVLVEASPRDRIWGIGLGKDNPKAADPYQWRGQNLLGFCLMEVRDRLRTENESL